MKLNALLIGIFLALLTQFAAWSIAQNVEVHGTPTPISSPAEFKSFSLKQPRQLAILRQDGHFVIFCDNGQIDLDLNSGAVNFEGCTPAEGARAFWNAVEAMRRQQLR